MWLNMTRSSALAERPHDASYLSVTSFNIQYLKCTLSFLLWLQYYQCIKLHSVLFSAVVNACCDKQDSLMCGSLCDKRISTLSAVKYSMVETVNHTPPVIHPKARYWLRMAIFAYPTCIQSHVRDSPSAYCHSVWYDICSLVSTEYTNVRDNQTDRRTDRYCTTA